MENFECFYGGFGLRFLGLDRVSSYEKCTRFKNWIDSIINLTSQRN